MALSTVHLKTLLFVEIDYCKRKRGNELTRSHTVTPFDAPGKQAF